MQYRPIRKLAILAGVAVIASLGLVQPARADLAFSFLNAGTNTPLLTSVDFSPDSNPGGNPKLTVSGYKNVSVTGNTLNGVIVGGNYVTPNERLYAKFTSGDPTETGLGTKDDSQHEITNTQALKLDFSQLALDKPYTLTIGSVQSSEGFKLYDSSAHYMGTSTANGAGVASFQIPTSQPGTVFFLTATAGNVLLNSVVVTTTPEPATVAMALTALPLLGLGALARRRRRARS